MYNEQKRLDVISNNLANSATVGYKKEGVTSQAFHDLLTIKIRDESENWQKRQIGDMSLGVKIGEVYTDYGQGSLRETGMPFDIAIEGDGFFTVNVTDSQGVVHERFTRAGNYNMTYDGYLVDVNGFHLQGESGDVQVPVDAANIVIDGLGGIYADGEFVDNLIIKDFEDYEYLKKFGDTYYEPVKGATEKDPSCTIRQGYTEQSNVNVIKEMVDMITITRAYEAGQKVIQAVDDTVELSVSSVGKV